VFWLQAWGGFMVDISAGGHLDKNVLPKLMLLQMRWTECLHGDGSLRDTLTELSELFHARVVHLHRTCTRIGRQRAIASVDHGAQDGERPLTSAIGPTLLSCAGIPAQAGTVWTLEDLYCSSSSFDERSLRWLRDRCIRDVAAIALDRSESEIDVLELYLTAPLPQELRRSLEIVSVAFSKAWARRQKGRLARLLSANPAISQALTRDPVMKNFSPLSTSNPFNLTAAEFGICAMMQSGLTTTDLMENARISESTLRTHLRNIYSKTEVSGQLELVRLLLAEDNGPKTEVA